MFHRQSKSKLPTQTKSLKDLTAMVSSEQLLADQKRQQLLEKMRGYSGLDTTRYDSLCLILVHNFVDYCQNLPESTNSYYSQPGGLLDHALNRTEAALELFQNFLIRDAADVLSEEQMLWQYALYSAAMLQGIGKLYIDYHINLFDVNGHLLRPWNPLLEKLIHVGSYYKYEFQKEADLEFRRRLNLLLAKAIMPTSGFSWIASNPGVLTVWLALLNEDQRSAGTLGAILIRAESLAIQRYFAEFLLRATAGRSGGPYGRAGTFSGGVPESVVEKDQLVGVQFIQWMIKALGEGIIMVNKAPLMMVPGGLLMCAEMFQLFVRGHPEYKNWQAIQKGFLSLGLHRRAANGSLNSRFEQAQSHEMHTGIILADYAVALPDLVTVNHLKTGKKELISAVELIHHSKENDQFIQQDRSLAEPLKKLAASGQWQNKEHDVPTSSLGAKQGV